MARARCAIEAVLLEFLAERGLARCAEIAVAFSGGPDSTALLAALSALGQGRPIALHVDHGIRGEMERQAELELVGRVCASVGARLLVARVRPGAVLERAASAREGIEAAARGYRYAALRASMGRSGARAVLLGHTMDDQVETILMRVFGGAGAGGLRGMSAASGAFLRPFLGLDKAALLGYLRERGLDYSSDSTNSSDSYLRNRIRHRLIPTLDSVLPGWRRGLLKTANKASLDEAALGAAASAISFVPSPDGSASLLAPSAPLREAPRAIAARALVRAAGALSGSDRFSWGMASAALDALGRGKSASYSGAGLLLRERDGFVQLRRGLDFPRHGGYFVLIDRPGRVRVGPLVVRASWVEGGSRGIRSDAFSFPLVVRSRRPGDAIALKDGTKRLDALFSEWALPRAARQAAPVVEDREGIVAVLGADFGGRDRFRANASGGEKPGQAARSLSILVKGA